MQNFLLNNLSVPEFILHGDKYEIKISYLINTKYYLLAKEYLETVNIPENACITITSKNIVLNQYYETSLLDSIGGLTKNLHDFSDWVIATLDEIENNLEIPDLQPERT